MARKDLDCAAAEIGIEVDRAPPGLVIPTAQKYMAAIPSDLLAHAVQIQR